ncbi:MAG TPA: tRNA epoxyqueuosine(34) reductase QueG [Acidimicrobiia bacterium]|nr:tRNA epoxyqueuosine(34) reductase QueG [Acidimicrobiia bacterium]
MDLRQRLLEIGDQAGLARMGFTSLEPFPIVSDQLKSRKASGASGGLGFTFNDPDLATTPRLSFPWGETILVGAFPYAPARASALVPGTTRVSAAARAPGYAPIRIALSKVAAALKQEGFRAEVLVDDNRLVDRAVAVRAGLGWWGKNTMVLAPGLGPWFLLGSVVTDARIAPNQPMRRDCGSCSACIPACPTGALVAPGLLDARRCLAAWAQTAGVIPAEFREAMGDRIYGCDDCLEACPPGQRLAINPEGIRFAIDEILSVSDQRLLEQFGHWFIPDRDPRVIRRNALIAAGNSGVGSLARVVAPYAGHPDWLLRVHAVWALFRLGGPVADAVIADRLLVESDHRVRPELERASMAAHASAS